MKDRLLQPILQFFVLIVHILYALVLMCYLPIHLVVGLLIFKNAKFYNYQGKFFKFLPSFPKFAATEVPKPSQMRLVYTFETEQAMHTEIARQKETGYNFVRRSEFAPAPVSGLLLVTIDFELNPYFVG